MPLNEIIRPKQIQARESSPTWQSLKKGRTQISGVVDLARFIKPPKPGNSPIFRSFLVPSVADGFRKM